MTTGTQPAPHVPSTAVDALRRVRSGDRVFVHGAAAAPQTLIGALVARADQLREVEVTHLHTLGPAPYVAPEMARSFRHRALFVGSNVRHAVQAGRADFVPVFLSDIPDLFRSGALPLDVALLNVSAPDAHGYCSLGTSVDVALAAALSAKSVIAQINPSMPRSLGQSFVHVSRFAATVEVDEPPIVEEPAVPSAVELDIGRNVASLVEDGATIQMGIGAIPNAVLAALTDRRDLGVYTEMFTDGVVDLVMRGVVTGTRKPIFPGKVVASFVMGTEKTYRFLDDNPMVELLPCDVTNDTARIRRHANMVAINSAIQVDLTGQVCADSIGRKVYSGVGGQMDFMRGAALAPGGKPIIALPATARAGTLSRIVPALLPGAGVTTTRAHVHYVVTEYGVAALHGKSVRERAQALIELAAPQFRESLEREAHALGA
ncbi:MAG TPA: acetyl-CoA hydrolase/transferase C-terminal domain-containing protein [Chloroflexota bacterium]|nr:acetyl-CoA hydrolase/transferase C-terminal domain-containing protein [Chloroflexota bacterium]